MFSRLVPRTCELRKCLLIKYQTSALNSNNRAVHGKIEESNERDLVNFPRRVRPEYAPPTRFIVIPESWFQFFYPKTGVTGPYMFGLTLTVYLFSKEHIVLHGIPLVTSWIMLVWYLNYKYGNDIANFYNKEFDKGVKEMDSFQESEKQNVRNEIQALKDSIVSMNTVEELMKAKRENVLLQMESLYRDRLADVYKRVKRQLDFQVEIENMEKRTTHKNLVDYVIRNVLSSITADQEKNAMQKCIQDLNALGAKA